MENKYITVRMRAETLKLIRELAELRNTTVPRMIDEMAKDYDMDLRSTLEYRVARYIKDEREVSK